MAEYKIITDASTDLPRKYCLDNKIEVLEYNVTLGDRVFDRAEQISIEDFYSEMRAGTDSKTAQVSMEQVENCIKRNFEQGTDVILFMLSSGLSGSYSTASFVANEIAEQYPERKAFVVDTLCASLGEGFLVMEAVKKATEGYSIEELFNWAEQAKHNVVHLFTVDDLMFLHRGGRVSKTAAIAGSLLGIKPALHVDTEGKLINIAKVRGRKAALLDLVNRMEKQVGSFENSYVAISHGDCLEDAEFVAAEIKKRFGIKKTVINYIGPVIGSHSGPGTVALFFYGEVR